jgi:hypothetical protein
LLEFTFCSTFSIHKAAGNFFNFGSHLVTYQNFDKLKSSKEDDSQLGTISLQELVSPFTTKFSLFKSICQLVVGFGMF